MANSSIELAFLVFLNQNNGIKICMVNEISVSLQRFPAVVGVNSFADRQDDYYYILDNCPIAMKYTTKVRIIGNVFYDLDRDNPTVSIAERCATLAYPYGINVRELHLKMAHAPYYRAKS